MGFNAGAVVEPLDFDFTKFGGPKGTIKEPTAKQLKVLFRGIQDTVMPVLVPGYDPKVDTDKPLTQGDVAQALGAVTEELFESVQADMTRLVAAACSDFPSVEELETLPYRIRGAFFGWFVGQMMHPEQLAGVTKPSLSLVNAG